MYRINFLTSQPGLKIIFYENVCIQSITYKNKKNIKINPKIK
jgi:hypothetical protein